MDLNPFNVKPFNMVGNLIDWGATGTTTMKDVLGTTGVRQAYEELAEELDRSYDSVVNEAKGCLGEMSSRHVPWADQTWSRMGRWLLRAYDIQVDRDALAEVSRLDADHPLIWLPSHRSYLDTWMAPAVLEDGGLNFGYALGGANLNFFPFGNLAKRTGLVFIRRSTKDAPVYRLTLRSYLAHLLEERQNVGWAIEGGRTRTGKLRQPRYGILRYVLDAIEASDGPEPLVIPVAIVYDQLHELATMAEESRGAEKSPEDLRWLIDFARSQDRKLGNAYVDIGEPIPLRQRIKELTGDTKKGDANVTERIAAQVCHGINQATPVTATCIVTCALLAADRAVTLDELMASVGPLVNYIEERHWPIAGKHDLLDAGVLFDTLASLELTGVVSRWDEGIEPVWSIGAGKHLFAAFYRNAAIHVFVNRAIGELALLTALELDEPDLRHRAWAEALALRDLLKFEFFFAPAAQFQDDLRDELRLLAPEWQMGAEAPPSTEVMRSWVERARPHMAPLVLRPFLDAYHVVFERLAARGDEAVDGDKLATECLGVAQQWVLQDKVASEESVSLELFRPAIALAKNRNLLEPGHHGDLTAARRATADHIVATLQRIEAIEALPGGVPADEVVSLA